MEEIMKILFLGLLAMICFLLVGVIAETKTFMGYVHYCEKHKERYEGFCKENGHKSADWVRTNVVMDCYQPNETTQILDEMKGLLNEFNKSFQI